MICKKTFKLSFLTGAPQSLKYAVSKKQKIILSSFGMSDDDIRTIANEIGMLLENNKSLMYDTDSEGEDEEMNDYGTDTLDFFD
jgi:hypothetical protein